ncbi:MAG: phosphoribosylaminoimidazolesuccinocarboxamide synthase [Dehalococcoidia bacterium]|jgi:phosphoribosylaminoimidazole-succinocarboxamide synthase|nr:phosphoribosylaminoimidazolesuccinocarboxamide synthase [Dehalococcoidia bacterium]MDW8008816.1 phosphoribosylaminoimidazolesuccinocarboxamide synthase [Chloroflexota bacterium]
MTAPVLMETQLSLPLYRRGKVRDTYDLGDRLLMVSTDRISAFDVVLPTGIPDKGLVLTQLSAFWFERTADVVPNHFVRVVDSTEVDGLQVPPDLVGRAMLVRKAQRIDVECIVRGYLAGSAWEEYRRQGTVNGEKMPPGLQESQELPEPLFTPTTKAEEGHDQPITWEQMVEMVGERAATAMRLRSLALYRYARDYARERGIIIADTKFEFGWLDDEIILIDEVLTPDSSRFWPADQYRPGRSQPSFDKQFVRDYLTSLGWNRQPPAPELPPDIVERTAEKYREAFRLLTGRELLRPGVA